MSLSEQAPTAFTQQDRDALNEVLTFIRKIEPTLDMLTQKAPEVMAQIDTIMPQVEPMLTKFKSNPLMRFLG